MTAHGMPNHAHSSGAATVARPTVRDWCEQNAVELAISAGLAVLSIIIVVIQIIILAIEPGSGVSALPV